MPFKFAKVSDNVKVGAFYEINFSRLPPKTPEQLKSIRIVMVNIYTPVLMKKT